MLRRIAHIIYGFCLGILLIFGTTPKEFVHLLADHKDTIHRHDYGHDGTSLETQHHHCGYLDYVLTPFAQDLQLPFIPFAGSADYLSYAVAVAERIIVPPVHQSCLRGPPAIA